MPLLYKNIDLKPSKVWFLFEQLRKIRTGNPTSVFESLQSIYMRKVARNRFSKLPTQVISTAEQYVFFPLQVNSDTQLIYNSPYKSMSEIINKLVTYFHHNSLVIKTHPMEFEKNDLPASDTIQYYDKTDIDDAVKKSQYVITVNSSVGFQALEKHKKVLHLGESFYDQFPGVIKCNLFEDDLEKKIHALGELDVDWVQVDNLMQHFRNQIFLPGNWKNLDGDTMTRICQRILA